MTVKCPACLSDNLDNSSNCQVCGYQIIAQINNSGIYLNNGIFLKNGTYRIDKILGEGGFGITYQGTLIKKNLPVAIKEFWPEKAARQANRVIWPHKITLKEKQEEINNFKLESENQKKCLHPNIPKIYDFFQENNTAYIIMEYIEGETLYSLLKKQGCFSENTLLPYIFQVINALRLVHNNNFLHRDIKPDNIILNSHTQIISLIDFGSSKEFLPGHIDQMTRLLTPGYAPPEQYIYTAKRSKATDIYALCATIYELLTNQLPTESLQRLNAISQQLADPLISPRQIKPEISPKMEKILLTGMSIKVDERFQNVDDLLTALQGKFISPLHKKAQELGKQNKLQEAITLYQKCLQQESDNGEAAVELALIQIHVSPEQAAQDAEKALRLKPDDGRVYGVLGLIQCRLGNWWEAVILLNKAVSLAPQQPWIKANLAWSLAKCERWAEAQQAIDEALQLNGNCVFSLGLRGWILAKQGDYKSSLRFTTQAIFKSKNTVSSVPAWTYPYLIYALKQNASRDVHRRIEEFIELLPSNSYAWGWRGWQAAKVQDWQPALLAFKTAFPGDRLADWALLNQAIISEYQNNIPQAMKIYQQVTQEFPYQELSWFRLGTLNAFVYQRWSEARTYLEQAIKINPEYAAAYHNLAFVLLHLENENTSSEVIFNYQQAVNYYQQQNKPDLANMIKQKFQHLGFSLMNNTM